MSNCNSYFNLCGHCLHGKQNRVKYPSGATREKEILELIHIDVFGPILVPSLGGSLYYVRFIDEFSRNTWLYFFKKKSQVFRKFKEYKALVENQTRKNIKVLRIDNGGEFSEKEFEQFSKQCGITRQKTNPYTPQQNGVVERMNRSLMEKPRSMLSGVGLGQEFQVVVVETPCYLRNRSPTSTLVDKTPHEAWSGQKPSITHLIFFGRDAFMHVPKEKNRKMDNKEEKCIFVSYKNGIKGYKLWNLVIRKLVYNQDVVFKEVKSTSRNEDEPKEKGPEKMEFELKNEGSDSFEE